MKRKISIKNIILSIILAFVILSLFSFFYYKIPVSHLNEDGSTDYVLESNSIYLRADEGFGFGKTNNEGFANINDYDGNIDILLMGSSHVESQNVPINKSMSSLLNEYLPELETYNIGVSGHNFKVMVNNLDKALNKYRPKYVILETGKIAFSDDYIKSAISGTVKEINGDMSYLTSLIYKNPLFRVLLNQIEELQNMKVDRIAIDEANTTDSITDFNKELTTELLVYIKNITNKYDSKIIILYHPNCYIDQSGSLINYENNFVDDFKALCNDNDIYFLNMETRFVSEYSSKYIVPNGFINGPIGDGHLNPDGHRMIADELSKLIKEIEE